MAQVERAGPGHRLGLGSGLGLGLGLGLGFRLGWGQGQGWGGVRSKGPRLGTACFSYLALGRDEWLA